MPDTPRRLIVFGVAVAAGTALALYLLYLVRAQLLHAEGQRA